MCCPNSYRTSGIWSATISHGLEYLSVGIITYGRLSKVLLSTLWQFSLLTTSFIC